MKLNDKELRMINKALLNTNSDLLNDCGAFSNGDTKRASNIITNNTQLSRKITKYIKGDDENEMD